MDKFFNPQSLAVIGLSSKPNNIPRMILENLLRWGYKGKIYGVNPNVADEQVDGIKMFGRIDHLPDVPDLAVCLIPARLVPEMVEACGKFGIRRMAIPTGGFNELGEEGADLTGRLLANARAYGIRFVGPNSISTANTGTGLCLPFVPIRKPPAGGMSLISQSGGVGLMMWNFLMDENIGMAKFASIGNKLDLDEVDFLEYFGRDPETKIICMYLEGITRGRKLIEAAKEIDKPIVVFKSNTTEAGKRIAMSHTAAISSDEDIIDAAFDEAGIIRIYNYSDFVAATKAFQLPPMKGNRIMVMSPAGGFSVITADLCENNGFEFADPGDEFYRGLQRFANAGVIKFTNPLDMGDIYDPQMTAHVLFSVMHNDNVDGAVYVSQRPQMPHGENVFSRMFLTDLSIETWGAILSSGKPLGVCLFGPSSTMGQIKREVNFPIFNSPEEMVRAMALQRNFYVYRRKERPEAGIVANVDLASARAWFSGKPAEVGEESLELLSFFGVPVAESRVAMSPAEAAAAADRLGFPVVMKVISPDALHKSEAGGVMMGIGNAREARDAFERIRKNLSDYRKDARWGGVRVQRMAREGYDMFIGGKHDRSFGPVVFFGYGGIYVEVFRDVANALCPAGADQVERRIRRLKSYQILSGARGKAPVDIPGFVDAVVRVSSMLAEFREIGELDVNPLRILADGSGVLALDARMRIV